MDGSRTMRSPRAEDPEYGLGSDSDAEGEALRRVAGGGGRAFGPGSANKSGGGGGDAVVFLCVDISDWPKTAQLAILSAGVFIFFLLNGVFEEFTFKKLPEKFTFGWTLTFFELVSFSGFALLQRLGQPSGDGRGATGHNAALSRHLAVAVAMTASRGLTNVSLEYLAYPTQVIFKSTKLLAVMAASILFLAKRYAGLEWLAAFLLVVSAAFFSLGDVSVEPNWSHTGVVIVVLSLVADAAHGLSQDLVLNKHRASVLETMLYTNFYGAGLTALVIFGKGELFPAYAYLQRHPEALALFIARSFTIYLGVLCFAQLIKTFSVVLATAVTTVRKILTILLSFVLFPKPFTLMYVYGLVVFTLGVVVQTYHKRNMSMQAAQAARAGLTRGASVSSDEFSDEDDIA